MTWSRRAMLGAGLVGTSLAAFGIPRRALAAGDERKAAIIARALSYERTLGSRTDRPLVIGIVFAADTNESVGDAQSWLASFQALSGVKVNGNSIEVTVLSWDAAAPATLRDAGADVVLVAFGLDEKLAEITKFTATHNMLSVGAIREYLDAKCTLGVFEVEDKLRITINLNAAERERVKFSSRLLKLADVIR